MAGALDRDSAASLDITIRATSTDGSSSTRTFRIALGDVDEFDTSAISDTDASANAVNENSANGTAAGITASASDADATNNTITYSLDDDAGGLFDIDPVTGIVTVAGALDRESAASHDITIRATSTDGSSSTRTFTIQVNDLDEFDTSAISDTDASANTVNENSANGTAVSRLAG